MKKQLNGVDIKRINAHCEKHDRHESWCKTCVDYELDTLENENYSMGLRIAELEKQNAELVAENKRIRCCGNCEQDDGYCILSSYKMIECKCNNLKHWKRKEPK